MAIEQLTSENIKNIGNNVSKKTPYEVATALGFNRNRDKHALAKDAGIDKYTGTAEQNIKIKEMLLAKIDELKNQEQNIVLKETENRLNKEKISIYNKLLNKITYADGKISSQDQNIAIARNDGTSHRITTPNQAIPLIVDGKGIVIKYTDPISKQETLLAIDDFKNNTFIFRDITEDNTSNILLYAADENKGIIEMPEVTIVGTNDNITITPSSSSSEEKLSGTTQTLEPSSSPNPSGAINQSDIDSGTLSEQTKESGSLGASIEDLQNSGKIPLVLTEDILQNYHLNHTNYPTKKIEETYYPGTTIPYAEVYNYLYGQLKQHWEGKNISFTNLDGERVSGTINFVGGVFTINEPNGNSITIQDVYELGPDYVIFRSENQEGISELYKLTKGSLENTTFLATIEKITTDQQDKTSLPPEQLVENK